MRYRVGKTGFLERHVKTVGKGEVWEAMGCPWTAPPQGRQHCGLWCPLFEYAPGCPDNMSEVELYCGGRVRPIFLSGKEG